MQALATEYVMLVLAVGHHDPDYVDAYYGPAEWRTAAVKRPLAEIDQRRRPRLPAGSPPRRRRPAATRSIQLRHRYLARQLEALRARVRMLEGARLSFDEESKALYDAVAPPHDAKEFQAVLAAARRRAARAGPAARPLHALPRRLRDPGRPSRRHLQGGHRRLPPAGRWRTCSCRPTSASPSSTSPTRAGAATTGIRAAIAASSRSTPTCRSSWTAPSTSPATKAIPGTTSTTSCSRRRWCAIAAGPSIRSTRSSRRSRSSPRARPTTASRSPSRRRIVWRSSAR